MEHQHSVEFRRYLADPKFPVFCIADYRWTVSSIDGDDPLHFHNLLEIGYCHDGAGQVMVQSAKEVFRAGTFTVIPANLTHSTKGIIGKRQHWDFVFVDMASLFQKMPLQQLQLDEVQRLFEECFLISDKHQHPAVAQTILQIVDELTHRRPLYTEKVTLLLQALLVDFVRMAETKHQLSLRGQGKSVILQALDSMQRNCDESVTVLSLAKQSNMSEQYFRKLFKEAVGCNPLDYLNSLRVQKACTELTTTDQNIINIAMSCGFASVSTFNRNFLRETGYTPSQYRKEQEGGIPQIVRHQITQ